MQETIQLIDNALNKAQQDLNNSTMEANYTPEFLIGLLTELKQSLSPNPQCDIFEIIRHYSHNCERIYYYIYKNNISIGSESSMENAIAKVEMLKTNITSRVLHYVISE
jgi:hypothetical protein